MSCENMLVCIYGDINNHAIEPAGGGVGCGVVGGVPCYVLLLNICKQDLICDRPVD